jgi:hypothetical protein
MSHGKDWIPKIGQKVVLLIDGYRIKKGEVMTVVDVKCYCCVHLVLLDNKPVIMPFDYALTCKYHGGILLLKKGEPVYIESCCMAPIEPMYADATKEIAGLFPVTEETPDTKIKTIETVNN